MADTKITTVAEELREAAATLRETAAKATSGPWTSGKPSWAGANAVLNADGHPVTICGEEVEGADHPASTDAAWIALVNPDLAEPLASWLETAAVWHDETTVALTDPHHVLHHACGGVAGEDCACFAHPLAVARVLNGTAS